MKIDEISIWEAFYGVAKHGNFTKASKALRITLPQISKRVSKLEVELGVRLFQRSTRAVSLTDEGRALLPKVSSVLQDIIEIESFFENKQRLSGTVRITCVPFVAHRLLVPVLAKFTKVHPDIHIELELSESMTNLIESNIDMAIRIHTPTDTELVYKKLAPNDLIFCASPDYLKLKKAPTDIKQLRDHELLMLNIHKDCRLVDGSCKLRQFESSKKLSCNNGAFLTDLALNGFGILVRSIWDVQEHLQKGTLVQVLKKYPIETFGHIYAVIPSRRLLAPRVRIFLDFIEREAALWRVK